MSLRSLLLIGLFTAATSVVAAPATPPNVILIYADDLAYADLSCTGAKDYATPHLDRMAKEGIRFTDFYVSSAVCSASRAALLTGKYHERLGVRGAFPPKSGKGLDPNEVTIAEMLRKAGYATAMAGKWHLGDTPNFMPQAQGFDQYEGIPYSGDMWPFHPESGSSFPPLPYFQNEQRTLEAATADDQKSFTTRYAEAAVKFIKANQKRPFFFYFAPNQPHVPLFVSEKFAGKSKRGLYGDVMMEIDWAVGQILDTLEATGQTKNTLVMFTSDNGPWLSYGDHAGSAGVLREGKGTCFEGGIRVPFIARWPGKIPANSLSMAPVMTIDLLPTIAHFTGAALPETKLDGKNIAALFEGQAAAQSPHESLFFYYGNNELQAMRSGSWKLHFPHTARTVEGQGTPKDGIPVKYKPLPVGLELYDLNTDISERNNLAASKPEIVAELQKKADAMRGELGDRLTGRKAAP
jgi:arylsulfatase A